MKRRLLIVDDEKTILHQLSRFFSLKQYDVVTAQTGKEVKKLLAQDDFDAVLQDLRLPDIDGLTLLREIKREAPAMPVIIITGFGDIETAVQMMQAGAANFVPKPVDLNTLLSIVEKVLNESRLEAKVELMERETALTGESDAGFKPIFPQKIHHAIHLMANNPSTMVLILGETGTGKGIVAKNIHESSDKNQGQFVEVNCAALREDFLISELFGHEKGAFTDAKELKRGLFELAKRGTVFLDEIGEMSKQAQLMLLKAIEDRKFRRLGGTVTLEVETRIIAATNADLEAMVQEGKFRKDLYYRLNVMPIKLPPLRERSDDIIPLAEMFMKVSSKVAGKNIKKISKEVRTRLVQYDFPGNIRELKNLIERAVLLSDGTVLDVEHFPGEVMERDAGVFGNNASNCYESLEEAEKRYIKIVLEGCGGNRTRASQVLGIHRFTLIQKIKKYGW